MENDSLDKLIIAGACLIGLTLGVYIGSEITLAQTAKKLLPNLTKIYSLDLSNQKRVYDLLEKGTIIEAKEFIKSNIPTEEQIYDLKKSYHKIINIFSECENIQINEDFNNIQRIMEYLKWNTNQ